MSREVARDVRDVSEMHRTIMGAFPQAEGETSPRALYKVLYRLETNESTGGLTLYVQSAAEPDWDALPDGYVVRDGDEEVRTKSVAAAFASIKTGQRLRFRLRANPTRKIDTKTLADGLRRHGRRVPVRGDQEQLEWLRRQGERRGFALTRVGITASGSSELHRSTRNKRTFQGVLYDGTLVVTDAEAFGTALVDGIGPGKAFGFGLLSIAAG